MTTNPPGAADAQEELDAIRARHDATDPKWQLVGSVGIDAHADRTTLLRHVARLSAELAKERERRVEVDGALRDIDKCRRYYLQAETPEQRDMRADEFQRFVAGTVSATLTKETP